MTQKDINANANINRTAIQNVNNVNLNLKVEYPESDQRQLLPKPKSSAKWYIKAIIGGAITLAVSVCGYYIKKNIDGKGRDSGTIVGPRGASIQAK